MKTPKKLKSLIIVSVIILLLLGAGTVVKEIFLRQVKKKIQASFDYSHLRLSFFPPALIIDDARSAATVPFFSAKKISVKVSYRALLSKRKPLSIIIENPVLKIAPISEDDKSREGAALGFSLPFAVETGVVKGGELHYASEGFRIESQGINAIYTQRKDEFSVQAESLDNIFWLSSNQRPLQGKIMLQVEGKGKEIRINRVQLTGPDGNLKAEGQLSDIMNPEFQLNGSIRTKTAIITDLFGIPFEWEGEVEGEAELTRKNREMAFRSGFTSKGLVVNKVFIDNVEGDIVFNEKEGGDLELNILKRDSSPEFMGIRFKGDHIEGTARRFHLEPIMNYLSLPWPVSSPAWGGFQIDKGKLTADVEFRDEIGEMTDLRFPLQGFVHVEWDGVDEFSLSSEEIASTFARVELEGKGVVEKDLDFTIKGDVTDVRQARQFTSLFLLKEFGFPEIRGRGEANIRVIGSYDNPQVKMNFDLSPGGFERFDASAVKGEAEVKDNKFIGNIQVEDPSMKGTIGIFADEKNVEAYIQMETGRVEDLLPVLDIEVPLKGEASGNFKLEQTQESIVFNGDFSSSLLKFVDQPLTEVQGKLEWQGNSFSLSEFRFLFHGGEVTGSTFFRLLSREFDIDVRGEKINLSSLYPDLEGELSFNSQGKGAFDQDVASGRFAAKNLYLYPFQRTEAEGDVKLRFNEEWVKLEVDGNFLPGENEFHLTLDIPLVENPLSGEVRGVFTNFDLLLPWTGAKGRINYLAELKDLDRFPKVTGAIDFQGSVLPFPKFAHALRDYSGLIFVENQDLSLRSFKGKLGDGDVQGSGQLKLGNKTVERIDFKAEGNNLLLSPLERTQGLADGNLHLVKDENRFVLEGDLYVHQLSWRREVDEKFVFYSTPYYEPKSEPEFFDDLTLNVRLRADDNAWMENSLGRIRGKFDLTVAGHVSLPVILGDLEVLEGTVFFQDRKFNILRGRVSFINPSSIEPYLDFTGETYVKDYRVTFSLNGLLDKLNPAFSSSPPLPPEDVLALLALGEAFKRTYHYDRSTQLSTTSLLSFQISEEAKKRAPGLFNIDRFRIDPFIMGSSSEMTARLSAGKKITRNFFVLYSTNLASQREEITRIEWELTNDLSIVGIRDEKGKVSIDVKIHKRF